MSRNKRIEAPVSVPQEPILPYVEVERLSFWRYEINLHLIDGHEFRDWGQTFQPWEGPLYERAFTRKGAQRKAKRVLAKYMRQIGYRSEDVVRYVGKLV